MDIVTLGELLIDMVPSEAGSLHGQVGAFSPQPGGAPANVAVAAARLGASSAFIGKVGEDPFGHFLVDVLNKEGVETRGIRFDDEARTTMAVIAFPDGQNAEFVFYRNPGADHRLRADELDAGLLRNCKIFHFGSLSLTDEPARSATLAAINLARDAGALISFDVNYRPSLWKHPVEALEIARAMFARVHLLKVNKREAALLAGIEECDDKDLEWIDDAARLLIDKGPSLVLVTLGVRGSYYRTASGGGHSPPFQVSAVDTVGCGDAFMGGILVQILNGECWRAIQSPERLREALRFANAVGALTSLSRGAIPALPTAAQVEAFIEAYRPPQVDGIR